MIPKITEAAPSDQPRLLAFARSNFICTYAHLNDPAHMEAYISSKFSEEAFAREFRHPESAFYLCKADHQLIGYYKINFGKAQTEPDHPEGAEIERIYVVDAYKGNGIGRKMIDHASELARSRGLDYLWLGVWEKNNEALAFYQRLGFESIGSHIFELGDDQQTDLIMKLSIG